MGLMSGSSLDGLDIAYCAVTKLQQQPQVEVLVAETIALPADLTARIESFDTCTPIALTLLDRDFAVYSSSAVREFILRHNVLDVDLIVSHGHTLLHHPPQSITLQIGSGGIIAAMTGIDTLCDLRIQDIALGGQGAPLAALVDRDVYGQYTFALNLGGICNLSAHLESGTVAWDICGANQVLNHLASRLGHRYDMGGLIASQGAIDQDWWDKLCAEPYYKEPLPRSLDNGWVTRCLIDHIPSATSVQDALHTYVHFIAYQVVEQLSDLAYGGDPRMLVSGGGAHNTYLVSVLRQALAIVNIEIVLPSLIEIDYKEAMLMALMGGYYLDGRCNVVHKAMGSSHPHIAGALYKGQRAHG